VPYSVTNIDTYQSYFRSLATSHVDINGFVFGPLRRIMDQQRSVAEYPLMFLELPDVELTIDGDTYQRGYKGALLILQNAEHEDIAAQDAAYLLTETIIVQVLAKLLQDHQSRLIFLNIETLNIEAVSSLHTNIEHGWRLEFELLYTGKDCYNPLKWA